MALTLLALILIISYGLKNLLFNKPELVWTMVNVNNTKLQGDAHVIRTSNGKTILIDAGYREPAIEKLVPFLKEQKIKEIDLVFITHPHRDHYEGLGPILGNGIRLKRVIFNLPNKKICDREIPWGCQFEHILSFHKMINEHGGMLENGAQGNHYSLDEELYIEILYAYNGVDTPVGETDINDTSLIIALTHPHFRILFTGDLNRSLGQYLADNAEDIEAGILKVPHHGVEGVAPNAFFDKVNPEYGLVPTPKHLWCSPRGSRVRNWFSEKKIPVYVNGIHGDVTVSLSGERLLIETEHDVQIECRP